MNLIISFSGRKDGNCDTLAQYIRSETDTVCYFRELKVHPCCNCSYECFDEQCKYRSDDIFSLYSQMQQYDKVILIVPMYCGNPCSLYFLFHERSQDYFMHTDGNVEITKRMYIIGIFGSPQESPDFIPCLSKWFSNTPYRDRVLGIPRHLHGQKLNDSVLDIPNVKEHLQNFLMQSK